MPAQRAITAFRSERLNCAQSVLRAFQQAHRIPEDVVREAAQHGRGRAEGGRCGALHGALQLAGDDAAREQLSKAFVAAAGSERCREIRKQRTLRCDQCVGLAAELVSRMGRKT